MTMIVHAGAATAPAAPELLGGVFGVALVVVAVVLYDYYRHVVTGEP